MPTKFGSLEELRQHRAEREELFRKAVGMHESGELTDEEFAMVERKHQKRMQRLQQAEESLLQTAEASSSKGDGCQSQEEGMQPEVAFSDGTSREAREEAPPRLVEPSQRDLEILSADRRAVETQSPDYTASLLRSSASSSGSSTDDADDEEFEQLRELYGRELYARQQMEGRLKGETEAKQELSSQILELTRSKDEAHMKAASARKALRTMKKSAIGLLVVSASLLALLVIVYLRGVSSTRALEGQHETLTIEVDEARSEASEVRGELSSLRGRIEELQAVVAERDESLANRRDEIVRLLEEISQFESSAHRDPRKADRLATMFALLRYESPRVDDEALFRRVAAARDVSTEEVVTLLDDYLGAQQDDVVEDSLRAGIVSVIRGNHRDALAYLDAAIAEETSLLQELSLLRARSARDLGHDAHRVVETLQRAHELDPTEVTVRHELAEALVRAGLVDEAIEHYRVVEDVVPERSEYSLRLGQLLERRGRADEAEVVYQHALERHGDERNLLTALAGINMQRLRFADAASLLERALSADSGDDGLGMVHFNLVSVKLGLGDPEAALKHFDMARQLGMDVAALEPLVEPHR